MSSVGEAVVRIGAVCDGYDRPSDGSRAAFWGSGFFIAPGWVLTSAHVVDMGRHPVWRGERVIGITIETGEQLVGELGCALPRPVTEGARSPSWPEPDLALIRVPDAPERLNALWLSDRSSLGAPDVMTFGYSSAAGGGGDVEFVEAAGQASAGTSGPMVLQGAFVPRGCSGGPVVDMARGAVIGVSKGRVKDAPVARATPITALRQFAEAGGREAEMWHEVLRAHDRHHLNRFFDTEWSWPREQFELERNLDPGGYALAFNAYHRAQLFGRFAELPPPQNAGEVLRMVRDARSEVRQRGVQLRTHNPCSWREGVGLLYDLNDGRSESGRDNERAAVALYAAHVCRALAAKGVREEALAELKNWIWSTELTLDDSFLREKVRDVLKSSPTVSGSRSSYGDVVVEIDPDLYGMHPWRVSLVQADGQTSIVRGNETGAPRDKLQEDIRSALAEALSKGDAGEHLASVDFMLPRPMFDEPVEKWRPQVVDRGEPFSAHALPLGHRRTVALRDRHRWRNGGPTPEWHQRWRAVRQGQMTVVPLCSGHDQPEDELATWSRQRGASLEAVPVHCARVGSGPCASAMEVALGAGYPVALWRRCGERHDDCEEFRNRVDTLLQSAGPHGAAGCLREVVRDVRNQTAGTDVSLRDELVLLYDPPHGVPLAPANSLQVPQTRRQ